MRKFIKKLFIGSGLFIIPALVLGIFSQFKIKDKNKKEIKIIDFFSHKQNSEMPEISLTKNPLTNFSTKESANFLNQNVDSNTYTVAERGGQHSSLSRDVPLTVQEGNWMNDDEDIIYRFDLRDVTNYDTIIATGWTTHYIDDHDGHRNQTAKLFVNRYINPSHSYRMTIEFWNGDDRDSQNGVFTLRNSSYYYGTIYRFSKPKMEIISSSAMRNVIKSQNVPSWMTKTSNYYLNWLQFTYHSYGIDASGFNNTYPRIHGGPWPSTKTHLIADFTSAHYRKTAGISKNELTQASPYLFSILKNSTQQKDLSVGGRFWTDSSNQPKLHLGLNSILFRAYEWNKWRKIKISSILRDPLLNLKQKLLFQKLINDYKVNSKNFQKVKERVTNGESETDILLPELDIGKYLKMSSPKVNDQNIIKWLQKKKRDVTDYYGNRQVDNYHLLSQLIQNAEIFLKYRIFSGANSAISGSDDLGVLKTVQLSSSELEDYEIPLENHSVSLDKPSIQVEGFDINWKNNSKIISVQEKIEKIIPVSDDNLNKYFIDYDKNLNKYSAYYQPNPMDISRGISFRKIDKNGHSTSYNSNLEDKNGKKAFSAFLYKITEGSEEHELFFKDSSEIDANLLDWRSKERGNKTLRNLLNGEAFNKSKITYIVNEEIILIINPYTQRRGKIWTNPAWSIETVNDTYGGKTKVLADYSDGRLSRSFNKAFSMSRTGVISFEGLLKNGRHSLTTQLRNFGTNSQGWNIIVDTSKPKMDYSAPDEKLYYKNEDGKYYNLYKSTTEIAAHLKEQGIDHAKLSWVDSQGKWYEKDLPIKTIYNKGQITQEVELIIDYQGLFKVEYQDIAGNIQKDFLWLQKDKNKSANELSFAQLTSYGQTVKKKETTSKNAQVIWINDSTTNNQVVVNNLLSKDLTVKKLNEKTGQMETIINPSWITYIEQASSSIGGTISSKGAHHSLAGDELKPLMVGDSYPSYQGKIQFKQAKLSLPKGYFEISATNMIYKKDQNGNYVNKKFRLKILNDSKYSLPAFLQAENHPAFVVTTYENGIKQVDKNFFKPPKTSLHQLKIVGENVWRKVSTGFQLELIPAFIENLGKTNKKAFSVKRAPIFSNWYSSLEVSLDDFFFDKEGKYIIKYTDLENKLHVLKFLVFNYPRDFSRYVMSHKSIVKGKTILETLAFYKEEAIATKQDQNVFSLKGTMDVPFRQNLPVWAKQVGLVEQSYSYDFDVKVYAESLEALNDNFPGIALNSWIKIHNLKPIEEKTKDPERKEIIKKYFRVSGKGLSSLKLLFINPTKIHYEVNGTISKIGTPVGVPPTIKITELLTAQAISDQELMKTAYWSGEYIDVYEESGRRKNLLIDDDANPATPKVHLLEDKDHYEQTLAEWLAKGGTKDSFFDAHADPGGVHRGPKSFLPKKVQSKTVGYGAKNKSTSKSWWGLITGISAGTIILGTLLAWIISKRKVSLKFSKENMDDIDLAELQSSKKSKIKNTKEGK